MRTSTAAVLLATWLAACSPTFNWREVRAEPAALKALLPCKPDKTERRVPLAGHEVLLQVMGCETGGATFAIMVADVGDAGLSGEALAQWQAATLAHIHAQGPKARTFVPPGGVALAQSQRVTAIGQRADGSAVRSEAAYLAKGRYAIQAVIYADETKPEWVDTFFQSLRFE